MALSDLQTLHDFTFRYPSILLIPILMLLGAIFARRERAPALPYPQIAFLREVRPSWRVWLRKPSLVLLKSLFICALTIAAARPQRVSGVIQPEKSRNLVVSLDVSKSMGTGDIRTNQGYVTRLDAVKSVIADFIKHRVDDRIGIVVFGSGAFLQAPLTRDHNLVSQLVERLRVGIAGDGTAIGDGLGLALKRLEGVKQEARAVILMTDGVSNAGQVNPIKAAKVARDLGIKVHTIGIGSEEGPELGFPQNFFLRGLPQQAEFDEKTLKEIAEITGGVYFHAKNMAGLKEIYDEIDKLETTEAPDPAREQVEEIFPYFAWLACSLFAAYLLLARTVFLKVP